MGLTRPRAHQLQDSDYKQSARLLSASNVTVGGSAPATLDGASVSLKDRILVTGQTDASQNGLYYVTVVGSGSNGTWTRSKDADATGDITAGMTVLVTEGSTHADTSWKLTTDDPITLGTTDLAFSQASAQAFGIISAGGNSLLADSVGDTLTFADGTNIAVTGNVSTDTVTISAASAPTFTGNVTGGNLITAGLIAVTGNVTGGNLITGAQVVATANITGGNLLTGAQVIATGNVTGGNIITAGSITLDKLALTSTQTTVPPLQLTASSLNDGVGALRIDSVEPDIFLNDTNGGFATVTFANDDVQRVAFGRNSGDDFYLTVRDPDVISGSWRNDTFVADSSTGDLALGYKLTVTGNITGGNLITAGIIAVTGNVTGGNLNTGAQVIATGNITGGNIITGGKVVATSDIETSGGDFLVKARGEARFYDTDSSNYVGLRAGSVISSDITFSLPVQDGTSGQVLQTDGNKTLSFVTSSGSGGSSGYTNSTLTTHPAAGGNKSLGTGSDNSTEETPFAGGTLDAFNVSLGLVYDQMEPIGSYVTLDLGDSEAFVGA